MGVLEDLKALEGTELGVSDWVTIDQDRINKFAEATDDHQWIHVDPEKASTGPFGSTIAHGYLTLALIPALSSSALPVQGVEMALNYGLNRVRFITPVPVNGRVRARRKLLEATEVTGGVQIAVEVTIELEGAAKPACVAETLARIFV